MCCCHGAAADGADEKCYATFNTAGRFNGHCGLNTTSGGYLRCADEYAVSVSASTHCLSAVTLLVGWQEGYSACSSDVINTWDVLLVGWQERHPACSSDVSKTRGVLLMQNQSCKHGARFHLTTTSTHVLTSTETWLVQTEHATFAHMLLLFF